ncbi:MAG: Gfo/Idh/MocA family oxidoreductase [Anaerolineae bacterium]|nr:Gfo/Idh/MocA family oxidoreductase [Anaerolineae bacterium]
MTEKIRWGILSTANIGNKRVIPAIHQARNGVVAAVASRSLDKAQAFADATDIPKAYGSYEELLADPEIDAIYNPLPNSEHAIWSIRCAEAGKPVLCEKPLASDAAEAQRMVDAFAERGIPFAEAFMYRFHPQTVKVREMVASGAVGRLTTVQSSFTFPISNEANIRLSQSLAGGALMDVGCYCVNVMRLMTGEEPVQASALAQVGESSGVDETLAGVLSFPSGVVGHFDCGLRSHRTHTYEIRGTEGRILVESAFAMEPDEQPVIRWWRGNEYQEIVMPAVNHYTLMAEDFADALLLNRPPRFSGQDGVENMRVLDQLLAAAGVK